MKKILCFFVLFFLNSVFGEEEHEFRGKHFLASYLNCNTATLEDVKQLQRVMLDAAEKSGAKILGHSAYEFEGHGLTMVIMLSESHASIHTYPEYGACFVDLFTCGDRCSHVFFDEVLRQYLKPQKVNQKVFLRDHEIREHVIQR